MDDIPERHKLYRVKNIAYWTSTTKRSANWEATLEPVNLLPSGEFAVPDEHIVLGPNGMRLTKSKSLLGYILAQYIDGDNAEPTRSDCVDLYIENALDKMKAYLFKLLQAQKKKNTLRTHHPYARTSHPTLATKASVPPHTPATSHERKGVVENPYQKH